MTHILYLNNYMSERIVEERKNGNIYSQPANNKVKGITEALLENGCGVTILSSGLVNGRTGKKYKKICEEHFKAKVIYCPIIDLPYINTLSSIISMYFEIRRQWKNKKADRIIFYNYKPEMAWAAFLAKKFLKIPITAEFEDGYAYVEGMGRIKSKIFNITERKVSGHIDSMIAVNSAVAKKQKVPVVVVRGVINTDFYRKCRNYKKEPNSKFTVLYSGGLDKERGIEVLLESLKYLDIDCTVIVTGKGNIDCDDKRVDFRGFVPYNEVQRLMMQSDLLVQCQLSKHAFSGVSFPSKLFEYIAAGNPIVSSDMEEVMDFAGESIEYYYNDDPKELAAAVRRVYEKRNSGFAEAKIRELCEKNMPYAVGKSILECWELEKR